MIEYLEDEFAIMNCDYDIRLSLGCTDLFYKSGFLKDSHWNHWAEYNLLCHKCEHFNKNTGVYYGLNKKSIDFEKQTVFYSLCEFKSQADFEAAIEEFPAENVKKLYISGYMENLKPIENLKNIELLVVGYGVKLTRLWDMSKTPNIKELFICGAKHLGDLSDLITTSSLEALGFETIFSQESLSYVDSFQYLKEIPTLRELYLSGTMARDKNIDDLISIPNLKKLWISPNTYTTEDFAKFEALKFRINEEYGIYKNDDFICPLGFGKREFKSDMATERFREKYAKMMQKWIPNT